jgi:hypothetical protein
MDASFRKLTGRERDETVTLNHKGRTIAVLQGGARRGAIQLR